MSQNNKRKKPIPKSLRNSVWVKDMGKHFEGKCYVCRTKITVFTFECAHIVAEKKGGPTTLTNLRATCQSCNRSMGTQDLEEFRRSHFPQAAKTCFCF